MLTKIGYGDDERVSERHFSIIPFKAGLVSAARATHAWVLTGGTNTGAMKLVGEAVREGQFLVNVSV